MAPDKPRETSGREPAYIRQQRKWGRDVVDAIRANRHPSNRNGGGGFTPERQEWEMPHAFRGYFKNREELSASQPLVIQAGRVVIPGGSAAAAETEISMPANGDLYVVAQITLQTLSVTITSSASLPKLRTTYNVANWPLGKLEEVFTGVWSWTQYHQGDVILPSSIADRQEYGLGFWGQIKAGSSGVYSGDVLDRDAATDTTANFSNAVEVSGREGIPNDSIVWIRPTDDQSGSNDFVFEYHGAEQGTIDTLSEGTIGSPSSDNWNRSDQGTNRGVKLTLQSRTRVDPSTGELYEITRNHEADANGHEEIWGPEAEAVKGVLETSTDTYPYYACSDGTTVVARYAFADLPDNNAEWIHDGANFVSCSKGAISAGAATSPLPCVVSMPAGADECADLDISAFSDDFDDNDLDACKWDSVVENNGSHSETGGKAQFTTASSGTDEDVRILQTSFPDIGSDDFEISVSFTVSSWDTATGNAAGAWLNVFMGGASYDIFKAYIAGSADYRFRGRINDTFQTDVVSNSTSSFSLRVRRVSGTVYLDYDNGGGWTNFASGSQSATPTEVFIGALHQSPGASMTVTADNFSVS